MSKISAPGGEIDGKLLPETSLNQTAPNQFGLDWFRVEWADFLSFFKKILILCV